MIRPFSNSQENLRGQVAQVGRPLDGLRGDGVSRPFGEARQTQIVRGSGGGSDFRMPGMDNADGSQFRVLGVVERGEIIPGNMQMALIRPFSGGEQGEGNGYPSYVGALGLALLNKAILTEAGEKTSLADSIQEKLLGPSNALLKKTGSPRKAMLPTVQNLEKGAKKVEKLANQATTMPSGRKLLGSDGLQAQVTRETQAIAEGIEKLPVLAVDIIPPTVVEQDLALRVASMTNEPQVTDQEINLRLADEVTSIAQDEALRRVKQDLGADAAGVLSKIDELLAKDPGGEFFVDFVTAMALPKETELAKAADKGLSWTVTSDGLEIGVYYSSKHKRKEGEQIVRKGKKTIPWEAFAFEGEPMTDATQLIATIKPPKYVEVLLEDTPPFLRPWLRGVTNILGTIVFEPALGDVDPTYADIPPLPVRSPKEALEALSNVKRSYERVKETRLLIRNILNSADNRATDMVRPGVVKDLANNILKKTYVHRQREKLEVQLAEAREKYEKSCAEVENLIAKGAPPKIINSRIDHTTTLWNEALAINKQRQELGDQAL